MLDDTFQVSEYIRVITDNLKFHFSCLALLLKQYVYFYYYRYFAD